MSDKLQSVRDKIQQAFAEARKIPADVAMNREVDIQLISDEKLDAMIRRIPARPLREHSTPSVGRHRGVCHRISVPKADAATLIDRAVKAMMQEK